MRCCSSASSGLVTEYGIDYIKWDHNRDLHEAVHSVTTADGRRLVDAPAVHAHTLAFYRLLDDLRARHPQLEIESCSSGGARVDLGVLDRTDRIWTSDCNDALERASIQRWTSLLVPPELMGTHIGPATAHTCIAPSTSASACSWHCRVTPASSGTSAAARPPSSRRLTAWTALARELRHSCTPATSPAPRPPTARSR